LRLPGTVNPRNGRVARVIRDTGSRVSLFFRRKLGEIGRRGKLRRRLRRP